MQTKKRYEIFYLDSKFFNFLSSQIQSDDVPPEVKLDDVNNTELEKANISAKMRTQILFKLSGSMFFKWKK